MQGVSGQTGLLNQVQAHLVDAYCHGVLPGELGLGAFEAALPGAAAPRTTLFDSPAGFAIRRWCPPLLGLEPHASPARYLARRRELGAYEATRRLLRGTGVSAYLVDTGEPGELTAPADLEAAGAAPAYEIVRLEPLAGQVADTSGTVDGFLANLAEAVRGAAIGAAGLSCDGLPSDPGPHAGDVRESRDAGEPWDVAVSGSRGPAHGPPDREEVRRAASVWLARRGTGSRPAHPVLLRHLLWTAVVTGLPLLVRQQPRLPGPRAAEGFLRATTGLGTDVVLLPGPRHEAAAADLAADHPHVYLGIGTDPSAALDRVPFGKLLYASGTAGLPELYVTGAQRFRAALGRAVGERVAAGEWSAADGQRVAALVREGNARRLYRLPDPVLPGGDPTGLPFQPLPCRDGCPC